MTAARSLSPAPPGRPPARPGRRRQELLGIAAGLFADRGFANVTVDEIGDAAGISGPALYHHFAGKEALLGEMLVRISEDLLAGASERHARGPSSDELLDELVRFHCEFAVDQRALITVHFRDLVHARAEDQQRVRRLQARYATVWIDALVQPAAERGQPTDRRLARAAVHATFGLINSTPFAPAVPRAAHVDLLVRMAGGALAGLASAASF